MSDPRIAAVARELAQLEPNEEWPSNEKLGGGLAGTRDDEYKTFHFERAAEVLAVADDLDPLRQGAAA